MFQVAIVHGKTYSFPGCSWSLFLECPNMPHICLIEGMPRCTTQVRPGVQLSTRLSPQALSNIHISGSGKRGY